MKTKEDISKDLQEFARKVIKLTLDLPSFKLAERARFELISATTKASALYELVVASGIKQDSLNRIQKVLVHISKSKFWLEFIRDEELISGESISPLIIKSEAIIQWIKRQTEHYEGQLKSTFAGSWLLED